MIFLDGYAYSDTVILTPDGRRLRPISGGGGGSGPRVAGNPTQTVVQSGDPSLAELNKYMTKELKGLLPSYGGLRGLTDPRPWNRMDYGRSWGPEQMALGNLRGYLSGPLSNAYELQGVDTMGMSADPSMRLAAAGNYFDRITGPTLTNTYTAMGQGRSGGMGEAIAQGGASMALPISMDVANKQQQYGGTLMNYGQVLQNREGQRLTDLLSLAAAPRLDEAASKNAGMDTLLSMLSRFPLNSGAGTSTASQFIPPVRGGEPPVWQQVMGGLGSAVGLLSMFGMFCYIALALYGPRDPRFVAAFWEVNVHRGPLGRLARALYRTIGPWVVKSRIGLRVLRPFFNRVAQAGARDLGVTL